MSGRDCCGVWGEAGLWRRQCERVRVSQVRILGIKVNFRVKCVLRSMQRLQK